MRASDSTMLLLAIIISCSPSVLAVGGSKGYFTSNSSNAEINSVLDLRSQTTFSFRTCGSGLILSQTGTSGDYFQLELSSRGEVTFRWKASGNVDIVHLSSVAGLNNNQWYIIRISFLLGNIRATVNSGAVELGSVLLASSKLRRYLWDIKLDGNPLLVGNGFVGCVIEGPGVRLSQTIKESGVLWTQCPLEDENGCPNTDEIDDCWNSPCFFGGKCVDGFKSYECRCLPTYNGTNCENYIGKPIEGNAGCSITPCLHSGVCKDDQKLDYVCECTKSYIGRNCETKINYCASTPCKNNGICTDDVNTFSCNCVGTGYQGSQCKENIDECANNPCKNGAACTDLPGYYVCSCPPDYTGQRCDEKINDCQSNPCKNGGRCQDGIGNYSCSCAAGFIGPDCESSVNDCVDVVCSASRECVDLHNGFSCNCKPGFTGTLNDTSACVEVDECKSPGPCFNEAKCVDLENDFRCECKSGFEGKKCETNIDDCAAKPCKNGNCLDLVNDYKCGCYNGWQGKNCDDNIDDCSGRPCQNSGKCTDLVGGFQCDCAKGFIGRKCQGNIDECLPNPCMNGAKCIDDVGDYKCVCKPGYKGKTCDENINDCQENPCKNSGTCADLVADFSCACADGWMGKTCSDEYDACAFAPCKNGGNCTTTKPQKKFTCSCKSGFDGSDCSNNIDDCNGNTCSNGQICFDEVNNYKCACPIGFEGTNCLTKINECVNVPCKNGGSCEDGTGNYTCKCPQEDIDLSKYVNGNLSYVAGWTGRNCEISIDECKYDPPICLNGGHCIEKTGMQKFQCACISPFGYYTYGRFCEKLVNYCDNVADPPTCRNNGTCSPLVGDFECTCQPGFEGKRCESNINECLDNVCLNNGSCSDKVNGFECSCQPGWSGERCETNVNECLTNPCKNGGECTDTIGGYKCDCTGTGFSGVLCGTNVDDCTPNPCRFNVTCTDHVKDFKCACYPGFDGKTCENDIDECALKPCLNEATCLQRSNQSLYDKNLPGFDGSFDPSNAADYVCQCNPGFEGPKCGTNINECDLWKPCNNGKCKDGINDYTCECNPGYEGRNCSVEINECKRYEPCQFNSVCDDKVNDYECKCPDTYNGKSYGGKNCTTELTGCTNNDCKNDATCKAYLLNDGTQKYRCLCKNGFVGTLCDKETTVSFPGGSTAATYMPLTAPTSTSVDLIFSIRTTVADLVVVFMGHSIQPQTNYYVVELKGGEPMVTYLLKGDIAVKSFALPYTLNDGLWYRLQLQISTSLKLIVFDKSCANIRCSSQTQLPPGNVNSFGNINFGSIGPDVNSSVGFTKKNYIGCLQDIVMDDTDVIPGELNIQNLVSKCERIEQCSPDPCNGKGKCIDNWSFYECQCYRPNFGINCTKEYVAGTFGLTKGALSQAHYTLSDVQANSITNMAKAELSFFIRTRQKNAFIFYYGSKLNSASLGYTILQIEDGKLVVRVKYSTDEQKFTSSIVVNDGKQHLVTVDQQESKLKLLVGNAVVFGKDITPFTPTKATDIYVGTIPLVTSNARRRLLADSIPQTNALMTSPSYEGTIQNGMLNSMRLEMFDGSASGSGNVILAKTNNVDNGEVTAPLCDLNPCERGAPCTNVFYNDFKCNCTDGFTGKNCSTMEFCYYSKCPDNAQCRNKFDGYECIYPATFDGTKTFVKYESKLDNSRQISSVSINFRTRKDDGVLIYAKKNSNFVTFRLSSGKLQVDYSLGVTGSVKSSNTVNSALWYFAVFTASPTEVKLDVNGSISQGKALPTEDLSTILSNDIYLGGDGNAATTKFKGCMYDAQIGGFNLPFFSQLVNDSSTEKFLKTTESDLVLGCNGDDVCAVTPCKNGATCRDIWNAYECDCVLGFDGVTCDNNIDDCPKANCSFTGTKKCIDEVNSFSCSCKDGYTGKWCETEINECDAKPCENGAKCSDKIADFECKCTANFTGKHCDTPMDEKCDKAPCQNGKCIDYNATTAKGNLYATYNCSCSEGWEGRICDVRMDYCNIAKNPCKNGACSNNYVLFKYECKCRPGYEGNDCEVNIDECKNKPCEHGTCTDLVNDFNCACHKGWEGKKCEIDIDECKKDKSLCINGLCVNTDGAFHCDCSNSGYEGDKCQNEIRYCVDVNPCKNGADCKKKDPYKEPFYSCTCKMGYKGKNCDVVDCAAVPCENTAVCEVTPQKTWKCKCPQFYYGDLCQTAGPCLKKPCQNGATCNQTQDVYVCQCTEGWMGKNCDKDIDECSLPTKPCKFEGQCLNTPGGFNCSCKDDYVGKTCHSKDPCKESGSSLCLNSAACNATVNDAAENATFYGCLCTDGYTGNRCQKAVQDELNMWIIIGPIIAIVVVIIVVVIIVFLVMVRSKRANHGTYSPSRQETQGSRVEMNNVLKQPPEERLI